MAQLIKKRSKKQGLPPGTLIHIGERRINVPRISIIEYNANQYNEKIISGIEECLIYKDRHPVAWINIDGLHQIDMLEKIGECYEFHPLVLEDILNTDQRPKAEDYGNYLYIVLRSLEYDTQKHEIESDQISLILTRNAVFSFQEKEGDTFNPIREMIRTGKGRFRKTNTDYLAYSLMDSIVDGYFIILEELGEQIEYLEEKVIKNPDNDTLHTIYSLKRKLILLRKAVWPLREVISSLERVEPSLIDPSTRIFLRDLYDHTIQVIDSIETYRDMIAGILDIYLSSVNNRMNSVMKVLTIITTIFMPLTFIAGIYGMNFRFMPELEWHWGYPLILLLMLLTVIIMLFIFKKKKWL